MSKEQRYTQRKNKNHKNNHNSQIKQLAHHQSEWIDREWINIKNEMNDNIGLTEEVFNRLENLKDYIKVAKFKHIDNLEHFNYELKILEFFVENQERGNEERGYKVLPRHTLYDSLPDVQLLFYEQGVKFLINIEITQGRVERKYDQYRKWIAAEKIKPDDVNLVITNCPWYPNSEIPGFLCGYFSTVDFEYIRNPKGYWNITGYVLDLLFDGLRSHLKPY